MIDPEQILNIMAKSVQDLETRVGMISENYTSGNPQVIFEGDKSVSNETYDYVSNYTPVAGDRVMLIKINSGWVIIGSVN